MPYASTLGGHLGSEPARNSFIQPCCRFGTQLAKTIAGALRSTNYEIWHEQ